MALADLRTVRQLSLEVPAFSQASIRWAIFNSRHNGLAPALVKLGKRVLLDRAKFEAWVYGQHLSDPAAAAPAAPARRRRRQ
jgi:hypothetical protein